LGNGQRLQVSDLLTLNQFSWSVGSIPRVYY
jgi:hypothetical protein